MAAAFDNGIAANVGSTEATVYTAPTGGPHLLIGLIATNIYGAGLGITIKLIRGADTIYLAHNKRIETDNTNDILLGSKVSLEAGDVIKASAAVDDAFSVIATITEDILS